MKLQSCYLQTLQFSLIYFPIETIRNLINSCIICIASELEFNHSDRKIIVAFTYLFEHYQMLSSDLYIVS